MTRPAPLERPEPDPRPEPFGFPDRLWSIDDVAKYLNVSRRGVERLKSSGKLPRPALTIGRLPRWRPEVIREWIERGGHA
jgi:excisionase family DNA binding protein